ncbi:MAG: phosphoribosyltransferase family protein, partial [Steroidobacteraceae bacterium]
MIPFTDRQAAGRVLGSMLLQYRDDKDLLVLGLARGGVPVAAEVAATLSAPLDVLVVRKIGAPGQPEFALGAIASGDVLSMNEEFTSSIARSPAIAAEIMRQRADLRRREALYRNERLPLDIRNRTVILADDGAATGASMRAAVQAARKRGASRVIAAVPV